MMPQKFDAVSGHDIVAVDGEINGMVHSLVQRQADITVAGHLGGVPGREPGYEFVVRVLGKPVVYGSDGDGGNRSGRRATGCQVAGGYPARLANVLRRRGAGGGDFVGEVVRRGIQGMLSHVLYFWVL